jgi:hypothetical protein
MGLFLQIVGAVFVALFLVVIAAILVLRWKLKSWTKQMADQMQEMGGLFEKMAAGGGPMSAALGGMMEPLTLNLKRTHEEPDEDCALQIKAWTKGLKEAGFAEVGDFEAEPTMLWLRALTHPESGAAAAFYVMPMAGAWYDVTARLRDGTSITLTDTQREMTDMPPWGKLIRMEAGTPPAKAYEKLLRRLEGKDLTRYTPENFVESFEEEYRRGTLWRVKRGDTPDELKRITAADMGEEPDSEFVQQLLESRKRMRAHQIDELLKDEWLKSSDMSAYEYERIEDRLVVVHELTPPEVLIDIWGELYAGDEIDDEQDPEELPEVKQIVETQDPRQAFRMLQQQLPPQGRFEHFASIDGDIAGDLWLRPDGY